METETELNSKILAITMLIKDKHPELSKYLEEMPVTIPDEKNPHINVNSLHEYYNSLTNLLKKHLQESHKHE